MKVNHYRHRDAAPGILPPVRKRRYSSRQSLGPGCRYFEK